jgi:hypothetical protein
MIGIIVSLSVAMTGGSAVAAPAPGESASAGVEESYRKVAVIPKVGGTVHVTSDTQSSRVTSTDTAGRVSATITQAGGATSSSNDLSPGRLAAAGDRVDQGGQES